MCLVYTTSAKQKGGKPDKKMFALSTVSIGAMTMRQAMTVRVGIFITRVNSRNIGYLKLKCRLQRSSSSELWKLLLLLVFFFILSVEMISWLRQEKEVETFGGRDFFQLILLAVNEDDR